MNKIIGFTISKKPINHGDFDIFNRHLNIISFIRNGFHHYFWGKNAIQDCQVDQKFNLSFGNHDDLLDKNVIIEWKDNKIIIENDWLGSIPVYYNSKDLIISTLSLKCLTDKTIHKEGLYNFVEAGYSILEQTPFENVKFLRYYSKLVIENENFIIEYKADPIDGGVLTNTSDEISVIEDINNYIHHIENLSKGEIVIPTSGGYDSRLLNICINDKKRIHSFTFGLTDNPDNCSEVVFAKKISQILGTKWERIPLIDQNAYIDEWFKIFGIGPHLHGMYQLEFYKNISDKHFFSDDVILGSGIIGDAWSGKVSIPEIFDSKMLNRLFYSHGIKGNTSQLKYTTDLDLRKEFYEKNKNLLINPKARLVIAMRFKLILLSYLYIIPEYFGLPVWTPFLNLKIVSGMLNLPVERRTGRLWQKELFIKNKLDVESLKLKKDTLNTLDYHSYLRHNFAHIDINALDQYFYSSYLNSLNKSVLNKPGNLKIIFYSFLNACFRIRGLRRILRKLGLSRSDVLFVHEYRIIKTIDLAIKY